MTPPRACTAKTRLRHDLPPINVFVNGIEQRFVTQYDCDAGTVERMERSADNKFVMQHSRPELSVETVRGDVTVEYARHTP